MRRWIFVTLSLFLVRGVANSENSGFDGPGGWGPGQDQLNNNYYTELLDNGQVSANFELEFQDNTEFPPFPNQFFWQENDRGNTFMFNADMALAVDMAGFLDPVTGNVNCTLRPVTTGKPTCPASSLLGIAQEYAQGNAVWVRDYRDAFVKMINTGCGNGICITVPTD